MVICFSGLHTLPALTFLGRYVFPAPEHMYIDFVQTHDFHPFTIKFSTVRIVGQLTPVNSQIHFRCQKWSLSGKWSILHALLPSTKETNSALTSYWGLSTAKQSCHVHFTLCMVGSPTSIPVLASLLALNSWGICLTSYKPQGQCTNLMTYTVIKIVKGWWLTNLYIQTTWYSDMHEILWRASLLATTSLSSSANS